MTRHHRIDYIEFCVSDMAASMQFYARVFGWHFTEYSDGYVGFRHTATDEVEMGGFVLTPEPTPIGGTLAVIFSTNLQDTRQKVLDASGTLTKDTFAFPGGSRFEFQAPGGSHAAVWAMAD